MKKLPLIFAILFVIISQTSRAQSTKDTLLAFQYFKKADSLLTNRKFESSKEFFNKAIPIYKNAEAWEKVANCYNKISINQKYKTEYKESLESANNALKICKQYLNNNWQEAHAYDNIAHYYEISVSDFKTASAYFNKAFEIRKKIFPKNHEEIALSYDKIGMLFHKKGLIPKAFENHKKCLEIRIQVFGEDHITTADSYKRLAMIFTLQGKYEKAILYYNKALKIYGEIHGKNHISTAEIYSDLAKVYSHQSEYKKAEALLKKALEIRTNSNSGSRENLAYLYSTFGILYKNIGKYDASVSYYKKSLELTKETNSLLLIYSYYGLGVVYGHMGFNEEALHYKYKALKICLAKSKNNNNIGLIYNSIGISLKNTGNYEKALQFYKKSRDLAIEKFGKNHFHGAAAINNMANIYIAQENYEKALELLQEALSIKISKLGENHPNIATSYLSFGDIYLAKKQYKKASNYYLKALAIRKSVFGNDHNDVASLFDRLGNLNQEIQKFDKAMLYFNKALDIRKKIYSEPNQFIAASYKRIGELHFNTKKYQNALLTYKKAQKSNIKNKINSLSVKNLINNSLDIDQLAAIVENKAKTYISLYKQNNNATDLTNAIVSYQQADTIINYIRKTHTNYKDKINFSKTVKNIYLGAITTQLLVHKNQKDQRSIEEAFYSVEKSKSNTLKKFLTNSNAKNFAGLPRKIVALEKELRNYDSFYQSKIMKERSKQQIDSSKITHYESELFRINRRQDSLINLLEKNHPKYYKLKYKNDIVSVANIQHQLDDKTTILQFFTNDTTTYAFTISKNDIAVQELSTPQLTEHVEAFQESITSQYPDVFKQKGHYLYIQLIKPISDKLVGDQLIIIPDESLWHLNFELLLTQKKSSTNPKNLPYFLKDYAISYANSTSLLFTPFNDKHASKISQECLAFSFSDSTETTENRTISLTSFRDTKEDLPGTRKEIRAISNIIDGQYFYGSQAIETNFKKNAGQYNILHLALHGEVNHEQPENSKLYFTKSKDTLEDNLLYGYELFALDIPAELTVLSACNTGAGKIAKGEGIMSLGTAFQYAGTKSLLLTGWEVSDTTTPQLMEYFYTNLSKGMNKAKALQQAKLQYLETTNFNNANPFYWGAFYLVGDTSAMHFDNSFSLYWSIAIGILVVLLLIVFVYRKKKRIPKS